MVQQQEHSMRGASKVEIVFRYGNWNLVRISTSNIYAHHIKCDEIMVWPKPNKSSSTCFACNALIPDEIQALAALNNWED